MAQYNQFGGRRISRPKVRLRNYNGPYNVNMLADSRRDLLEYIDSRDTVIWKRIRIKTGIFENGDRDGNFEGWGESSTRFSCADLPEYPCEQNLSAHEQETYLSEVDRESNLRRLPRRCSATITTADLPREREAGLSANRIIVPWDDLPKESVSVTINANYDSKSVTATSGNIPYQSDAATSSSRPSERVSHTNCSSPKTRSFSKSPAFEEATTSGSSPLSTSMTVITDDSESDDIGIANRGINIENTQKEIVIDLEELEDKELNEINVDNVESAEMLYATKIKDETLENISKIEESVDVQIIGESKSADNDCFIVIDPLETECRSSGSQAPSILEVIEINDTEDASLDGDVLIVDKENGDQSQNIVYKCDLCEMVSDDEIIMDQHLKTDVHFSASTYFVDSDKKIVSLKEKLSLMNIDAMYKTILVVCPVKQCKQVFQDIFECSYHYQYQHDQLSRPMYRLVNIVEEETFDFPCDPVKCYKCGEVFELKSNHKHQRFQKFKFRDRERQGQLMKHYMSSGHFPYKVNNFFAKYFRCVYCPNSKEFFRNLKEASKHVRGHNKCVVNGMHKLKVICYGEGKVNKLPVSLKIDYSPNIMGQRGDKRKFDEDEVSVIETNKRFASETSKGIIKATNEVVIKQDMEENSISNSADNEGTANEDKNSNLFFLDRVPSTVEDTTEQSAASKPSTSSNGVSLGKNKEICEKAEDISNDISSLNLRYKCDYCDTISDNRQIMQKHLAESQHYCASTVLVDSDEKVQFMDKKFAIRYRPAAFKDVVTVCPKGNCCNIFNDIHTCSLHLTKYHASSLGPTYGLAKVVKEMIVKCPQNPLKCEVCGYWSDKRVRFSNHCEQEKHLPFVASDECDVYYFCTYCSCDFHGFRPVINHMTKRHKSEALNGEFSLKVILVSGDRVEKRLPPFPKGQQDHLAYLRSKLANPTKKEKTKKTIQLLKHQGLI